MEIDWNYLLMRDTVERVPFKDTPPHDVGPSWHDDWLILKKGDGAYSRRHTHASRGRGQTVPVSPACVNPWHLVVQSVLRSPSLDPAYISASHLGPDRSSPESAARLPGTGGNAGKPGAHNIAAIRTRAGQRHQSVRTAGYHNRKPDSSALLDLRLHFYSSALFPHPCRVVLSLLFSLATSFQGRVESEIKNGRVSVNERRADITQPIKDSIRRSAYWIPVAICPIEIPLQTDGEEENQR
ncbi:hypothetical protein F2P81_003271 [Scophthalmus maximus]|uniref:RNA-binding S4 domain-containing protein n=1 Tax=Scophthalmus maximus TaxID=52904 RepID=A0A6A4TDR9_SCOMX|nr:hypothetical protein F2P81_003271 [Scophthalmus maximus]